jgi:erythromycin esterase
MHEAIAWVRANAMRLTSVEAGHGCADLEALRHIIGKARIVSLGEATHGTREFFQLKHRLLEFCVAELGFTVFAIEASYPECLRINDHVLTGAGNPAEALSSQRFWTWDTEEVLALIEWMHAWNRTHTRKVKFYGFDMQFPSEAALNVLDYLKGVAPDLAAASKGPLWPLCDDVSADRFHLLSDATRDAALAAIERIVDTFGREGLAWVAASSEIDWQLARMNAVVLHQSARLCLSLSGVTAAVSRDVAMAENVRALLELEGPDTKAVLWAHNGHARRTAYVTDHKTVIPTMGSRLHELFGREQVVVGFAFNRGSFQAIQTGVGLVDHSAEPAPEGSLDQVLAAANTPAFLLNLATAPGTGSVADWLASAPLSRSIGSVYSADSAQKFFEPDDPRRLYDVLAFVDTTTAARANAAGRRSRSPAREPASAPVNLDLAGSGAVPDGWDWCAPPRLHAHSLVLSDGPSPAGGRSLRMARPSAPWNWGEGRLEQTFVAEAWRGKRLHFSAAVCAEGKVPGTGAYLYIEVRRKQAADMPGTMPASALAITEPPVRCAHWKTYAVEIVIPDDAHTILIGLAFAGTGTAWFADLKLETCAAP